MTEPTQDAEDVRVCAFCGVQDDGPYRWSDKVQAWFCEDGDPEHNDGGACICGEINARHCPVHNDGAKADD